MSRLGKKRARHQRFLSFGCALLLCISIISHGTVSAETTNEYAVKSAFIANFILLTEWPEDNSGKAITEVTLCIVGDGTLPEPFLALEGKQVGTKVIHVVAAAEGKTLPDCQVVFYMKDVDTENLVRSLNVVRLKPVLTIGEKNNITRLGGAIHFYQSQSRLRFTVNLRIVTEQNLKMSSRLLQIATLTDE